MASVEARLDEFTSAGAQVVAISVDSVPSKKAWAESLGGFTFLVLSDFWPHGAVAKQYGVLREQGFAERATFVIGRDGAIRYADVRENIRDLPPLDEVLAAVQASPARDAI